MNIPNYQNTQFTNSNGYLTDPWSLILQQLISALQTNLSDDGYRVPQHTTAEIADLLASFNASSSPSAYFGVLLYDTSTNELKVNINGTFRVIQVV